MLDFKACMCQVCVMTLIARIREAAAQHYRFNQSMETCALGPRDGQSID